MLSEKTRVKVKKLVEKLFPTKGLIGAPEAFDYLIPINKQKQEKATKLIVKLLESEYDDGTRL